MYRYVFDRPKSLKPFNGINQKYLMDKRDLTMMFKIPKNMAPSYLTTIFCKCDNSSYSLRSNNFKLIESSKAKNRFPKKKPLLPWSNRVE